jgi:hypothetical protein
MKYLSIFDVTAKQVSCTGKDALMVEYQRWKRYVEDVGYTIYRQSETSVDAEGVPEIRKHEEGKWTISTASVST